MQQFRQSNPNYLLSQLVDPGADHFQGSPALAAYIALFIRKTARYRILAQLPPGNDPVTCLPIKAESGWLSDPDIKNPTHPSAPYAQYTGDKSLAMWHYDGEIAAANALYQRNLGHDQMLETPVLTWQDEGDGWTFKAQSQWLDAVPERFGGRLAGKKTDHAATPFLLRPSVSDPIQQIGPDTFRLLRPTNNVNVMAYHPGDETHRSTIRWGNLPVPELKKATPQIITFATLPDLKADAAPIALTATASSGLPVYYEVEFGPITIKNGKLKISDLPTNPQFPLTCRVTAYQLGRRIEPAIAAAPPVTVQFNIVKP